MAKKQIKLTLDKHIIEVRYRPNSKVLDYRGTWVEALSNTLKLPEWKIDTNRIDIFDKEDMHHAFVAYKNSGYTAINTATEDYFKNKAGKFIKELFKLENFGKHVLLERIGVRSQFLREYNGKFEDLVKKFSTKFISLTNESNSILNCDIIDVGAPLTMKDNLGNIHFMSGPMAESEIKHFFNTSSMAPKIGLFMDIDYWKIFNAKSNENDILKHLGLFTNSIWNKFKELSKLVMD